jgi:PAS domain S-box-containing protein
MIDSKSHINKRKLIDDSEINWFTATFPEKLEREYNSFVIKKNLKLIRIMVALALTIYLVFGLGDFIISDFENKAIWTIRLGIVTPLAVVIFLSTFSKLVFKLYDLIFSLLFAAGGFGSLYRLATSDYIESSTYFPGLLLIIFFCFTLLNIKFIWASFTGLFIIFSYMIIASENPNVPSELLSYHFFFIITVQIFGMTTNYILNRQGRTTYKFNMKLNFEKEDIESNKEKLENLVDERTNELMLLNLTLKEEVLEKEKIFNVLSENEVKYRNLVENSAESMVVLQDSKLVFVNRSFLDFTGVTTSYLENVTFLDFIHEDDKEKAIKKYSERINSKKMHDKYNLRLINKFGMYRWVEINASRVIWEKKPASLVFFRDVTDKKIIEDSLRESEKKYRTFIENAHDSIFLMNDRIFLDCNKRTLAMFACDYDDIIGDSPVNFSPKNQPNGESSTKMAKEYIRKAYDEPQFFMWKHKRKDGNLFDAEVSLNTIELSDSNYLMAIVRDVTDRVNYQNALLEKEEFLRNVIDISPNLIFVKNYEGEIILANKAMAELVDNSVEEIIGKKDVDYHIDSEDVEKYIADDKEVMDSLSSKIIPDERVMTTSGDIRYFHTTKLPLVNKKGEKQLLGVSIEITENKKYMEALMRSEERYRKIFDNSPEIIGLVNSKGTIIDINNKVYEWLGYLPDAIIGKNFMDVPYYETKTKEKLLEGFKARMTGEYVAPYELELLMPDGKRAYGLFYGVPLRNDEGEIEQEIILIADITARKQSEREIKDLNKTLEKRVESRTLQLKKTLDDLQMEIDERISTEKKLIKTQEELADKLEHEKELNELKSRFISMVSHEYRTPLTIIQTCSYIIEKIYDGKEQQTFDSYMEKIRNAVQAMTSLLEDVLFIGKTDAGKLVFNLGEIDIRELIDEIIEQSRVVDEGKHEYVVNNKLESNLIESDSSILRQIFSNLVSNAVKYSPENSIIKINLEKYGRSYLFEVIDEGIGVDEQDIDKVFEPFHRGVNIGVVPGTGLGLSIVKRSVKMLKGNITVESKPNEGTKFTLVLPTSYNSNPS